MVGSDLNKIADLLLQYDICTDVSSLQVAAMKCHDKDYHEQCKYSVGKLVFIPDSVGSRIPKESESLSLSFEITIDINAHNPAEICDPLNKLNFDIEIFGCMLDEAADEVRDLYSCWHFDRHIVTTGDGVNKYSHPHYHFTFGGNRMEEKPLDFGASLVLPTPRIAYPPMDAILGIDFIIQNYLNKHRIKDIVNDSDYKEIITRVQEKYWKPYYTSMAHKWSAFEGYVINANYSHSKLLPFLN